MGVFPLLTPKERASEWQTKRRASEWQWQQRPFLAVDIFNGSVRQPQAQGCEVVRTQ